MYLNYTGNADITPTYLKQPSVQAPSIINGGPASGYFDVYIPDDIENTVEATILELGLTGYQRVKRLMTVMEQTVPDSPQWPSEADFRLRVKLDFEEQLEKLFKGYYMGNPDQILDGAVDVEVVGIGSIVSFGVDYDLAVAEVDRANLSKLGEDGKPIKNEFGKFLKGPNYTPPNLTQFLRGLENVPAPYDTKAIVLEETSKAVTKALQDDQLGPESSALFIAIGNAVEEWAERRQIEALATYHANNKTETLIGGPDLGRRAYESQFVQDTDNGCIVDEDGKLLHHPV